MKITRAQKDAVLDLLREKFGEKRKAQLAEFKKANENKIKKEYKTLLEAGKKVHDAYQLYRQLGEEYEKARDQFRQSAKFMNDYGYSYEYMRDRTPEELLDKIINRLAPEEKRVDFSKIERQLELDSLSKEFDLNAFIEKYLQD